MPEDPVDLQALERDLARARRARQAQQEGGAPSCYTNAELAELQELADELRQRRAES